MLRQRIGNSRQPEAASLSDDVLNGQLHSVEAHYISHPTEFPDQVNIEVQLAAFRRAAFLGLARADA